MVLPGIVCYCMVLCGIAWYCMILHGIASVLLHGVMWYCAICINNTYRTIHCIILPGQEGARQLLQKDRWSLAQIF